MDGPRVKFKASVERLAAWELYVELNRGIEMEELGDDARARPAHCSMQ